MTDAEHRSFLGIPVHGDIHQSREMPDQRPLEELAPLIQAVLDDPHTVEFGWRQYTPYFNDGEPCIFSAGYTWIRTDGDEEGVPHDELQLEDYESSCLRPREWVSHQHDHGGHYESRQREPWQVALHEKGTDLERALTDGSFYNVLLGAFGDHAEITVRRSGIEIEFFEHE